MNPAYVLPNGTVLAVTDQTPTRSGGLKITGHPMPLHGPNAQWLPTDAINDKGAKTMTRRLPPGVTLAGCPPAPVMYGVRGGKCNVCGGPTWSATMCFKRAAY